MGKKHDSKFLADLPWCMPIAAHMEFLMQYTVVDPLTAFLLVGI